MADQLGYHVLGIQEARTMTGTIRSHSHVRFCSGRTQDGLFGIEIWISLTKAYCWDSSGNAFFFRAHEFVIAHSDPRLLVLICASSQLSCVIIAGHAPHSGADDEVSRAWWTELERHLERLAKFDKICLLDSNARISGPPDPHFGDLPDGPKDHNAVYLRSFASLQGLFAPATFSAWHQGPIATWFHPRHGTASRLDYVLLPWSWRSGSIISWVDDALTSGRGAIDHLCAATQIKWQAFGKMLIRCTPHFDRHQILEPANLQVVQDILHEIPDVSWNTNATQHMTEITSYLQTALAEAFPMTGKKRKPPCATQEAMDLHTSLTTAKRHLRFYNKMKTQIIIRFYFDLWRTGDTSPGSDEWTSQFLRSWALLTQRVPCLACALKKALRDARRTYLDEVAAQAAQVGMHEVFRLLKPIVQPKRQTRTAVQPLPQVMKLDGEMTKTPEELCSRWQEHFAAMEAGEPIEPVDLVKRVVHRQQYACLPSCWQVEDLPTLCDLEDALRRCQPGKAPGPDRIPPELLKLCPGIMASKLYPLLMKQCLRLEEAATSKGGRMVTLYKGKGTFSECANYRGIMVMNVMGKALRASARHIVNELYVRSSDGLQIGGKPAQQVLYGSQAARMFLSWGKSTSTSTAVIFCDIASAYYRALRELTVGIGGKDPSLEQIMNRLNVHEDVIPLLQKAMAGSTACTQSGATSAQQCYLQEALSDTWFHLGNLSLHGECVATHRGSRPGDSWADTIFNLLFDKVLHRLKQKLEALGLNFEIKRVRNTDPFDLLPSEDWVNVFQATWADDLAVLLRFEDALEIERLLSQASAELLDTLREYGMQASMGAGKTAALVLPRGPHAVKVRRRLFSGKDPALCILQEDGNVYLPLVPTYRHLGGMVDSRCNMLAELTARLSKAKSAFWRLAKKVLRNWRLPLSTRVSLFQSTVLSVLLWGSGSWPMLSEKEFAFFSKGVWDLYRLMMPRACSTDQPRHTHFELLSTLNLSHPIDLLCASRCRHYGSMILHAPPQLWSLLLLDPFSQQAYKQAIQWLWQAISMDEILPHYGDWSAWEAFIRQKPGGWKRLVSNATKRHLWERLREGLVNVWQRRMFQFLEERSLATVGTQKMVECHHCLICDAAFGQKRAWFLHAYIKHSYRTRHGAAAQGRFCPRCQKLYKSSGSLLNHLRYSQRCCNYFWHFRQTVIPQPDVADYSHPQCPWMPLLDEPTWHVDEDPVDETRQFAKDLHIALLSFVPVEEEESMVALLSQHLIEACKVPLHYGVILEGFEIWVKELGESYDPILRHAIDLVRTWLHSFRPLQHDSNTHFDFVDVKITACMASPTRTWYPTEILFLHFCSGRRRDNDLQSCLEQEVENAFLTVISVDIAIDDSLCDLLDDAQCSRWITLILNGEICGTGIGPPCETWSIARFHVVEHLEGRQPRPLRSLQKLWGFLGVRFKEHLQLDCANRILCFGLYAALIQAISGGFSFVEHPLDPRKLHKAPEDAPTIWATLPLVWFEQLGIFCRLELQQGHFGARSAKPTCFMLSGIDSSLAMKIEQSSRICALPKQGSIGLLNGAWATSPLKEYPEHICRMLARMFDTWLTNQKALPQRNIQSNLSWIHNLCVDLDQRPRRAGPGPDYAGGRARHN